MEKDIELLQLSAAWKRVGGTSGAEVPGECDGGVVGKEEMLFENIVASVASVKLFLEKKNPRPLIKYMYMALIKGYKSLHCMWYLARVRRGNASAALQSAAAPTTAEHRSPCWMQMEQQMTKRHKNRIEL